MPERDLERAIQAALAKDDRYSPEAYLLVNEAINFSAEKKKEQEGGTEDVSGRQILEGFEVFAKQEFGPMAATLLDLWGLEEGEDVGEVVFNLIEVGYLHKQEHDSKSDFAGGNTFYNLFRRPYLPSAKRQKPGS